MIGLGGFTPTGWPRSAHDQPVKVATPTPKPQPRVSLVKPYRARLDLVYSANFRMPPTPRFLGPCLIWPKAKNNVGYGVVHRDGKLRLAHRWHWEQKNGPVPEGLELDHLCNNPVCYETTHLEAVTHAENQRRLGERQTHCKRGGHPRTPENTYVYSNGSKACRICAAERNQERRNQQ